MTLTELLELLDHTPVVANVHPVSLCFLPKDIIVLDTVNELVGILDEPNTTLPQRFLITSETVAHGSRIPYVNCEHEPFSPALNEIIFDRFDDLLTSLLTQSQISDRIVENAHSFDLVLLVLVDGLSYEDLQEWSELANSNWKLEPCLVDVPTITRLAFPNLVGMPTIAERLFDHGFHRRLGFTYWNREDNNLTDRLFHTVVDVNKVSHFDHILTILRKDLHNLADNKYYVQIMRTGLDGYAHSQRRHPPVTAVTDEIKSEFVSLTKLVSEICVEFGSRASVYLTSDHGILWLSEFEPLVVGSAPAKASPRWCDWRKLYHQDETGHKFVVDGKEYYCLGYPKLRRPPRIDEQGVHGGISYQESIIPFLQVRIEPQC